MTGDCKTCGRRKAPRGRDPGVYAASGYCGHGCPGYDEEPKPGHFWPGEEPELRAAAAAETPPIPPRTRDR